MRLTLSSVAGPRLTVCCLAALLVLTAWGTVYQASHDPYEARARFFESWAFLAGNWLPVPGAQSVLAVLAVNLLASLFLRFRRESGWTGLWLTHLGLLVLIAGGAAIRWTQVESALTLAEGSSANAAVRRDGTSVPLPMTVRLLEFEKEFYPQSDLPKSFRSRVEIDAHGVKRQAVISMNHPFRHGGYTLCQSSYDVMPDGREVSTLAVTYSPARYLPYLATSIIFAGLAAHFLTRRRLRAAPLLLAALLTAGSSDAGTNAPPLSLREFEIIPILEGGRVMPMDTFARLRLLQVPGPETSDRAPAIRGLADLFFGPETAAADVPIVPPDGAPGRWLSPREILARQSDPQAIEALLAFHAMAQAYAGGSQGDFDVAACRFRGIVEQRSNPPLSMRRLKTELLLNRWRPFSLAGLAYGLALLAALALLMRGSNRFRRLSLVLLAVGWAVHGAGLAARSFIMARPPVTNLYSTFVFAAFAAPLLGLLAERRLRNGLGLLCAALGGLGFLLFARRFETGDTLHPVVAVLASNLWLAAHVLTVMIGFAGCLMAGIVGHVYLLQRWRRPAAGTDTTTYSAMHALLGIGLTFTFLGTMLGGVWADQTWGRFWGWDPKENGALLVILWCAILLHARPAGLVGPIGLAAGCVLLNAVVALAWLGVNLLGVGLHSYGWTQGVAAGLGIFVVFEAAFAVAAGWPLTRTGYRPGRT